ncbi:N-acetyltransferase [Luteibacter aegosomatis]|uniref:GNAT family N-acetyltransferase n=1 Tax=Luteibacter aegosomatis TaxID=2911537 RepID=UPI001FF77BC5|nr:N-acetyltransferase [Luteibacter aegosomatis]UPG83940.1 N-acetyltransferase [Luteibacter aegosomatis]
MAADIVIRDAPDEGRFVAELGRQSASAWYERGPGMLRFVRVDISQSLIADGVGIQLMRVAMSQARAQGLLVEPACDFVANYMRNHPDTQDLLTSEGWRLLRR